MVVDDVEQDGEPAGVTSVDQCLQRLRPAITRRRRKKKDAVIPPIAATRKFSDRHQFDSGDAEPAQIVEMAARTREVAAFRKRADMQLVKNDLLPAAPSPVEIGPVISLRVDNLAGAVNAIGLMA